jgi:hypothetical protein
MSEAPAPPKPPGPEAFRYHGTGSVNNDGKYPYADAEKWAVMGDFIEVLRRGYTVDRAVRLLSHWATSEEKHRGLDNIEKDEPHETFGRAVPSRKTFYVWRDENVEFREAWDEAIHQIGTEALEDHALDMAFAGDSKMVQFLLKARNPAKYANFGAMSGGGFNITITPADQDL